MTDNTREGVRAVKGGPSEAATSRCWYARTAGECPAFCRCAHCPKNKPAREFGATTHAE